MTRPPALAAIWAMATAARGEEPLPLETMVLLGALIVVVLLVRGIVMRRFVRRRPRRPQGDGGRSLTRSETASED
ncbi:hypothetical protein [Sphingomonas sp.]